MSPPGGPDNLRHLQKRQHRHHDVAQTCVITYDQNGYRIRSDPAVVRVDDITTFGSGIRPPTLRVIS